MLNSYGKFQSAASRQDKPQNDVVHFFSSHFALPTAYALFRLGFSANGATYLFITIGLVASLCFALEHAFLAYALFRLHIIIDMADGNIARATKKFNAFASGIDKVGHLLVNTSLMIVTCNAIGPQYTAVVVPLFLSYYMFNLLFTKYPKGISKSTTTISKVMVRNIIGLEGYVLSSAIVIASEIELAELPLIYAFFFLILFTTKIRMLSIDKA